MKIIIDTDKKELILIGLVTLDEISAFSKDHNLEGYSISSTDTSTHWYRGWQPGPLDPPYKITCTSGPITVNHDQKSDFGYRFVDPNKYTVAQIPSRQIIGMREDNSSHIEPMTPEDGLQ